MFKGKCRHPRWACILIGDSWVGIISCPPTRWAQGGEDALRRTKRMRTADPQLKLVEVSGISSRREAIPNPRCDRISEAVCHAAAFLQAERPAVQAACGKHQLPKGPRNERQKNGAINEK